MSVATLPSRAVPSHTIRPVPVLRPGPAHATAAPPAPLPLNVTIELSLPLDGATQGLLETLDALRDTVRGIMGGTLRVSHSGAHAPQQVAAPARIRPVGVSAGPTTLRILPEERGVWIGSREIRLSRLEFDLLLFLADHPKRVFSRRQLLESVWGYTQASRRTVDVHIRRLRMKLEAAGPLLTTIRGVGYRLDNEAKITVTRSTLAA